MQTIDLHRIDLGDGVFATKAWLSESPFVLVQTATRDGNLMSRLDVQKGMFIDPLPGNRTSEGVRQLVLLVQ